MSIEPLTGSRWRSFLIAYGPWSTWTPCSTFCGIGTKQRNRSCVPPGSNCGNYTYEQRACGEANCQRVAGLCPIDSRNQRRDAFLLLPLGIKETEPEKYPMKGYLALREGDILCVPKNSNESAKHMADLVSSDKRRRRNISRLSLRSADQSVSLAALNTVRRTD